MSCVFVKPVKTAIKKNKQTNTLFLFLLKTGIQVFA